MELEVVEMKMSTIEWINIRLAECESELAFIKKNHPDFTKSKKYYGIVQEANTLRRILKLESEGS